MTWASAIYALLGGSLLGVIGLVAFLSYRAGRDAEREQVRQMLIKVYKRGEVIDAAPMGSVDDVIDRL